MRPNILLNHVTIRKTNVSYEHGGLGALRRRPRGQGLDALVARQASAGPIVEVDSS